MRDLSEINLGVLMYVFCNLRAQEWDAITKLLGPQTIDSMIMRAAMLPGPKWCYGDVDKPAIVGGFVPQRQGVYSSWFFPTAQAWSLIAKDVTKVAVERKQFMFEQGAHRIETVCLASDELAQVWYRKIGFTFESTLKAYCADGTDAASYVEVQRRQ